MTFSGQPVESPTSSIKLIRWSWKVLLGTTTCSFFPPGTFSKRASCATHLWVAVTLVSLSEVDAEIFQVALLTSAIERGQIKELQNCLSRPRIVHVGKNGKELQNDIPDPGKLLKILNWVALPVRLTRYSVCSQASIAMASKMFRYQCIWTHRGTSCIENIQESVTLHHRAVLMSVVEIVYRVAVEGADVYFPHLLQAVRIKWSMTSPLMTKTFKNVGAFFPAVKFWEPRSDANKCASLS